MDKDKKPLYYAFLGVIPYAGSSIASFSISEYLKDFVETLRYIPFTVGLSLLSTFLISYYYFRNFLLEIIAIVSVAPLIIAYFNTRKFEALQVNVNEYYIEIIFKVPVKTLDFESPTELFDYVYSKALKRLKPPYLLKLKALNNCGNLRVTVKEEEGYIILRKRCGDTSVEVKIYKDKNADLKVTMSY
ncbi:hypothetical protein [Stygiolobus caldivivus]|uniref:Uncharacterized protein n=1 Tax=Stygiolobus caldivivus TaxID=2824673 RepID=A0A8D5U8L6_9CREN|nr:hypothetical protein [Stygiolobus caldivivus]BCU71419.1 hypothetical protein KN1_27160 [Stygiolobus caldivivus]